MDNENVAKGGKWSLTCGVLLAIFGGLLAIVSALLEVVVLVASGKVPPPTGTAEYNQYYMLGVYLGTCCLLPPFIVLGVILLIVGIWLIRRKPKS